MSTITLGYSNSLAARRSINLRWIALLITGLVLIAGVILVAASASTEVQADTPASVVAVAVQTAPAIDAQYLPEVSSTPAPSTVVVAVPAATPPAE